MLKTLQAEVKSRDMLDCVWIAFLHLNTNHPEINLFTNDRKRISWLCDIKSYGFTHRLTERSCKDIVVLMVSVMTMTTGFRFSCMKKTDAKQIWLREDYLAAQQAKEQA